MNHRTPLCRAFSLMLGMALVPMLGMPVTSFAKTESRYETGKCPNDPNREWFSVTTVVDGEATHISGRDCQGRYYDRDICEFTSFTASNPLQGLIPTHTGLCDDGTSEWRVALRYNADFVPVWLGGTDCSGRNFVIQDFTVNYPDEDPRNLN